MSYICVLFIIYSLSENMKNTIIYEEELYREYGLTQKYVLVFLVCWMWILNALENVKTCRWYKYM